MHRTPALLLVDQVLPPHLQCVSLTVAGLSSSPGFESTSSSPGISRAATFVATSYLPVLGKRLNCSGAQFLYLVKCDTLTASAS